MRPEVLWPEPGVHTCKGERACTVNVQGVLEKIGYQAALKGQ